MMNHLKDKFGAVRRNPNHLRYRLTIHIMQNCVYKAPRFSIESQQKIKIKKETKIPRVTDEGWNSQKQLSGPVEQKKIEKKRLLCLHPKLSPGLVPYRLFYRVGIACTKMVY